LYDGNCKPRYQDRYRINGTGFVLVVVNEEALARGIDPDIIQRIGYTVIMANSGERGLELYQQQSHEIVAVLLDMSMPGDGWQRSFPLSLHNERKCERDHFGRLRSRPQRRRPIEVR
jgi:CheY-like chemotaxis protein